MIITNRSRAPEPILNAIKNDPYDKGTDPKDGKRADFSVTELIDSARLGVLKFFHPDQLTSDVALMRHSLYGQLIHLLLERAATVGDLVSKRFYIDIEVDGNTYKVSCEIDRYSVEKHLQDWKFVSTFKFKGGVVPDEYQAQLNLQAEIMRRNGYEINGLDSVPLYKDYLDAAAERGGDYPPNWFEVIPVTMESPTEVTVYLTERIRAHVEARVALPLCSPEERWATPAVYAVMKPGRKAALRLYDSKEEADEHAAKERGGVYVVSRPQRYKRCEKYCPAASFCVQYQTELKGRCGC